MINLMYLIFIAMLALNMSLQAGGGSEQAAEELSRFAERVVDEGRAMVELIGARTKVDDLGDAAGTIGYEFLTSLGARYERVYTGG